MRRIKGYYFSLFLFFWCALPSFACLNPVSLTDRVDNADHIALGKVIESQSIWDDNRENIYTVYTIKSEAYLKEATTNIFFEIIILGGIVDDEAQLVTPSITLLKNKSYLFLLESIPALKNQLFRGLSNTNHSQYQLYAYTQGAMPRVNGFFEEVFGEPIEEKALFNYIEKKTNQEAVLPNGEIYVPIRIDPRTISVRQTSASSRRALILKDGTGTPTTVFYAGTSEPDHQLIIEGSGFGTTPGYVKFSNSDNGGDTFVIAASEHTSDLETWTDSQIKIKIPLTAGSGIVEVYDSGDNLIDSQSIDIQWSIKPIYSTYKNFEVPTRQFINFINYDELGGYTLVYNSLSGLAGNTAATTAFERAVDKWICATGIHWTISETATTSGPANDGVSTIMFSEDMPQGVVAMTSSRYKASGNSSCDLTYTTWYLKEFDMQFVHPNNIIAGTTWNYTTAQPSITQFDFETIALHELGHAHGLGHINNANSSMYFSIENGVAKRGIQSQELNGALYQMGFSLQENCISSKKPMLEHDDFCGHNTQLQESIVQLRTMLEGYYDTNTNLMRTDLLDKSLLPTNQPFDSAPFNYGGFETIIDIPNKIVDWLLVGIRSADDFSNILCQKAVLLQEDGTVVDIDGNTDLNLDCISPGTYYISITHHNHMSVVSSSTVAINATATLYDFTSSMDAAMGSNQLKSIGNTFALSSGDFDCNGIINNEDYNIWKLKGATINSYSPADSDGNGIINNADYNNWKLNRSKIGIITEH